MEKNTKLKESFKKERLKEVLSEAINKKNGNRVRHLVRIVANAYDNNPERLKRYFNDFGYIAGIATSAYHFLTGDIKPIQTRKYGGLGAMINDSESGLEFGRCQLWFAKLSGKALQHSNNSDTSLYRSTNSGKVLFGSKNSDEALQESVNSDYSLHRSVNSGDALYISTNSENALRDSNNSNYALKGSNNSNYALNGSNNSENALRGSDNSDMSLYKSTNSGDALENSTNSENALRGSNNSRSVKRNIIKLAA